MPGFVDTHRHTWQTPVRGVLPSCTLDQYFSGMLDNIGIQYRAEDVYIANLMGALEALNGGITTLLDWSHVNNTPEHSDAAIHGLAESGIRAIYAHGPPVGASWWAYSSKEHPEDIAPHPQDSTSTPTTSCYRWRSRRARREIRRLRSRSTTGSWRAISASASACTWVCG